jgi:pyruvate formate lyase activating enzyme
MGLWLEIVTLLIPGFNDAEDELRKLCEFVASVSPDIPWHVTAFHTDYKMQGDGQRNTTADDLLRAAEIGRQAGLHYVYAGNLPGRVGPNEDTRCRQCNETLIRRYGYLIEEYRLTAEGHCPSCNSAIPGRWSARFEGQIASRPFLPRGRSLLIIENR